jgi:F0F1-type ATP synthase delta subunit
MKHTETIARSMRKQIMKGTDIETVLSKTEEVLRENKQQVFFVPALQYLLQLLKKDQSLETLVVESAFALDQAQIDQISKKITGKAGTAHSFRINSSLLAGFVATYRGKAYDGSARQYITKLGKQ